MTQASKIQGDKRLFAYTELEKGWGFKVKSWTRWERGTYVASGKVAGYFPTETEAQEAAFRAAA